ncbi:MAG TPA: proline dehydrogenase family protein [Phototrophicaceae bacterium]|jgi:proline dehydrogenase|nr:proline dehydrogenase family protein [Phototrophicaceae bacterium]
MEQLLRRFLLYLSTAGWARSLVSRLWVARRVARRFVAGETLQDAINATVTLNQAGLLASLDYLGESVSSEADTQAVVQTYQNLLTSIHDRQLKASVSLKLTHLGLDISEDLCIRNLRQLLTQAQQNGNIPVTIDMESSHYTETTLRIYRTLRDEYSFANVGTVIQAYLYRSLKDMQELTRENARIRICKGAYLEPADVAFPVKADVDKQYAQIVDEYLTAPTDSYLDIATHDEAMIQSAQQTVKQHQVPSDRYEFQMLYGIRSSRQTELASAGYKVRVYVPFGEAWYPYFMRRLAERPANLWFFARSFFRG